MTKVMTNSASAALLAIGLVVAGLLGSTTSAEARGGHRGGFHGFGHHGGFHGGYRGFGHYRLYGGRHYSSYGYYNRHYYPRGYRHANLSRAFRSHR